MATYDYDLFTIGAGSGGVAATRRAGALGARVAICEENRVGGTCVLRGCVPKKLMVYASTFSEAFADAPGFGWSVGETKVDWARLVAAKDAELDRLHEIYLGMLKRSNVDLFDGRGTIVDAHTVEVAGRRHTAERILIATGGWPTLPEVPGIEHAITSNDALELKEVPKRVAVVGGGYIGVEFAGIWSGAGSKVTVVARGEKLLRGFDEDVRTMLGEQMQVRGIEIRTQTRVRSIEKVATGLCLNIEGGGDFEVDQVLYATGRHPHSRDIGLEEVGVLTNAKGAIIVDQWSKTNVEGIWAVGDVTPRMTLTPVAIADGRAFVETEFRDNPTPVDHGAIPTAVFSTPPIGTVGLPEHMARELGTGPIDIYRAKFRPMKNVLSGRDERTLMKLVVERESDRVLGLHMVGPDAPEIVQGFAVAIKAGATKRQFDATVGIHPSSAEEFVTMMTPVGG